MKINIQVPRAEVFESRLDGKCLGQGGATNPLLKLLPIRFQVELEDLYTVLNCIEVNISLRSMANDDLNKSDWFIFCVEEREIREDSSHVRAAPDTRCILHQVNGVIRRALVTWSLGYQIPI